MRFGLFILFFFAGVAEAADAFISAEIPFQFREGFLWIEVRETRSERPLRFLLDSGASVSVIDIGTAESLHAKLGRKVKVQGVQEEVEGYWRTRLNVTANATKLPTDYLALDLSLLSGECKTRIDGLIGLDFFKGRIIQIDFVTSVLKLLKDAPSSPTLTSVPIEFRACGIRLPINVNGNADGWVRLDTGCASGLQWVENREKMDACLGKKTAVGLLGVSIGESKTDIRIGGYFLKNVPTGVHPKQIFPGEDGLLGNEVLQKFAQITVDSKNQNLLLQPKAEFLDKRP